MNQAKTLQPLPQVQKLLLLLLLSHFSRVRLRATPQMAAHQAPPSPELSRQEHWSGLPCPSPMRACRLSRFSRVQLCATPWTAAHQAPVSTGFSRHTGVGCHFLLQPRSIKYCFEERHTLEIISIFYFFEFQGQQASYLTTLSFNLLYAKTRRQYFLHSIWEFKCNNEFEDLGKL